MGTHLRLQQHPLRHQLLSLLQRQQSAAKSGALPTRTTGTPSAHGITVRPVTIAPLRHQLLSLLQRQQSAAKPGALPTQTTGTPSAHGITVRPVTIAQAQL